VKEGSHLQDTIEGGSKKKSGKNEEKKSAGGGVKVFPGPKDAASQRKRAVLEGSVRLRRLSTNSPQKREREDREKSQAPARGGERSENWSREGHVLPGEKPFSVGGRHALSTGWLPPEGRRSSGGFLRGQGKGIRWKSFFQRVLSGKVLLPVKRGSR